MDAGGPSCKVLQAHQNSRDVKLPLVLKGNTASLSDLHLLLVCMRDKHTSLLFWRQVLCLSHLLSQPPSWFTAC